MGQPSRALPPSCGARDYPYDPAARMEELRGIDRLRGIADRKLAEHLYLLYVQAERNSTTQATRERTHAVDLDAIRRVAARALVGEFGADARELAEYLLLDGAGRKKADERSLVTFGASFRRLRAPK